MNKQTNKYNKMSVVGQRLSLTRLDTRLFVSSVRWWSSSWQTRLVVAVVVIGSDRREQRFDAAAHHQTLPYQNQIRPQQQQPKQKNEQPRYRYRCRYYLQPVFFAPATCPLPTHNYPPHKTKRVKNQNQTPTATLCRANREHILFGIFFRQLRIRFSMILVHFIPDSLEGSGCFLFALHCSARREVRGGDNRSQIDRCYDDYNRLNRTLNVPDFADQSYKT